MPYEGYVMKCSKHMPTESYLYLAIYIEKFMIITQNMSHLCGSLITQKTSTQNMSNSHVYFTDESESTSINADES